MSRPARPAPLCARRETEEKRPAAVPFRQRSGRGYHIHNGSHLHAEDLACALTSTVWRLKHLTLRFTSGLPGGRPRSSIACFRLSGPCRERQAESGRDEWRVHLNDPKTWRTAVQAVARVLKGWQEEADPGSERRTWRWLLEGDSDADGYDHTGEPLSLWGFLRIGLERGGPGDPDKGEDIDLQGFGLRIWGERATKSGPGNL